MLLGAALAGCRDEADSTEATAAWEWQKQQSRLSVVVVSRLPATGDTDSALGDALAPGAGDGPAAALSSFTAAMMDREVGAANGKLKSKMEARRETLMAAVAARPDVAIKYTVTSIVPPGDVLGIVDGLNGITLVDHKDKTDIKAINICLGNRLKLAPYHKTIGTGYALRNAGLICGYMNVICARVNNNAKTALVQVLLLATHTSYNRAGSVLFASMKQALMDPFYDRSAIVVQAASSLQAQEFWAGKCTSSSASVAMAFSMSMFEPRIGIYTDTSFHCLELREREVVRVSKKPTARAAERTPSSSPRPKPQPSFSSPTGTRRPAPPSLPTTPVLPKSPRTIIAHLPPAQPQPPYLPRFQAARTEGSKCFAAMPHRYQTDPKKGFFGAQWIASDGDLSAARKKYRNFLSCLMSSGGEDALLSDDGLSAETFAREWAAKDAQIAEASAKAAGQTLSSSNRKRSREALSGVISVLNEAKRHYGSASAAREAFAAHVA